MEHEELEYPLVLVPQDKDESESVVTTFGRFLFELKKRYEQPEHRIMAGAAKWQSLPVEEIAAFGLWVVMVRVAKKYNLPVATERQIIEVTAPRVNRLINAGIALQYENIQEAVIAFDRKVIGVIKQALELGYRPGMQIDSSTESRAWKALVRGNPRQMQSAIRGQDERADGPVINLWLYPSMNFFAELFKTARTYGEEIARMYNEWEAGNWIGGAKEGIYLQHGKYINEVICFLNPESSSGAKSHEGMIGVAKRAIGELKSLIEIQRVLRKLPVRVTQIPERSLMISMVDDLDARSGSISTTIEDTWIKTQLLLAAGNLPDREHLKDEEYIAAIRGIKKLKPTSVVNRFMYRMKQRSMLLSEDETQLLFDHALRLIERFKGWTEQIDDHTVGEIMIVVGDVNVTLTPTEALEAATTGMGVVVEEVAGNLSGDDLDEFYRRQIIENIIWEDVNADDFKIMVSGGFIPIHVLVEGVAKMPEEEHDRVVKALLLSSDIDKTLMSKMIGLDLVDFSPQFVADHLQHIPTDALERYFPNLVHQASNEDRARQAMDSHDWLKVILEVEPGIARLVVGDPKYRKFFVAVLFYDLQDQGNRSREDITDLDVTRLQAVLVGSGLWEMYGLANELELRTGSYEEFPPTKHESKWKQLSSRSDFVAMKAKDLMIDKAQVVKLFDQYSEDDVFRWLYADRRDLSAKLDEFTEQRRVHFATPLISEDE